MIKKAIILHAWYSKPQDNWYPWLKEELEKKGYKVHLSELPTMNSDLPDMELLLSEIGKIVDEETILVGHSLTCLLAMRLAERRKFKKMVLVAGWDFDDLTPEHRLFWKKKIDHQTIRKNVQEINVVHSDNDPYFTSYQAQEMSKRFGGNFTLIKGAGHFTKKGGVEKIPQILEYL